jgi:TFIIF-interacting CTD phosphatase-like protein
MKVSWKYSSSLQAFRLTDLFPDNAVPIEGWISDPTDHELLHLIPLFEGLQYVTDVRALLALRQGQAQQA